MLSKYFFFLIGILVFVNYPSADLPVHLLSWRTSGAYFYHNQQEIFFLDRRGEAEGRKVLVCLHGFPSSSFDWIKILDDLEKAFSRIILIDFIGFGFSNKPNDYQYSICDQANMVEALLKQERIEEFHLLTHDYGDTVAQEMIARYNDRKREATHRRIISLCMLNGGIFPEIHHPRPLQKLLLIPLIGQIASRLIFYQLFKFGFSEVFGNTTQPSDEEFQEFWVILRYKNGDRILHRILQYVTERHENRDRWVRALQETSVPVHTIYGPADPVNPPDFIDYYRKTLHRHSLTVLPTAIGHYPQLEAPQKMISAYKDFLLSIS